MLLVLRFGGCWSAVRRCRIRLLRMHPLRLFGMLGMLILLASLLMTMLVRAWLMLIRSFVLLMSGVFMLCVPRSLFGRYRRGVEWLCD